MTSKKRGGFTLIEMLVVVAIVGLLSSVVVVGVGGAREKARDAKRVADLRQIQTYLETAYSGSYPDITGTNYPSSLPKDPSDGDPYSYCRGGTNNQSYALGAELENAANRPSGGIAAADLPSGCAFAPTITCANADTSLTFCIRN